MATITSLGFNITAKWDGTGLRTAQAQLDSLKKTLSSIDGDNLRVTVDVDDAGAIAKINSLRESLDRVASTHATATANVNVNSANLNAFQEDLNRVASTHATATANANVNNGNVEAFQSELSRIAATHATATADVNVNASNLEELRARLVAFGAMHETATADVDVSTAGAHLHELTTNLGDADNGFRAFSNSANGASLASAAFSKVGLITIGVLAGIGPAAALAGTALVTALGGSFVAVGAIILAQNAQVKSAMVDLKNSVVSEMEEAADGMKGPLLAGIAQLKSGLAELEPAFAQAFTAAGPLIQPIVQSFLNFTNAVMPGVITAVRSAGPVFAGMSAGMQALGAGLGDMFRGLAAGAQGFGQVWVVVGTQVGAILGTLGNAFGRMASVGATALNNLLIGVNGLLGGLLSAVTPLIAPLGLLTRAIGVDLGNALRLAGPGIGQLVSALVSALIPVLNILLPVLGELVGTLASSLVPVIQAIAPLLQIFATGLATILEFLRPILPIVVPLVAGLWLLNAALLANPVVLIAAGIVLLVGALVELAQHWSTVWNAIKTVAETVWNFLTTGWGRLILAFSPIGWLILLATNWSTVWNGMKIAAQAVWTGLQIAWSAFINAMAVVWTTVSTGLVIAWNAVWNAMGIAARAIWTGLQVAWTAFINALSLAWTVVGGALMIAWNATWNAMSIAVRAIWTGLQIAWSAFITGLTTAWTVVSTALQVAWSAVWNAMSLVARTIWNALQVAWSAFINAMTLVWNTVGAALSIAWNATWNAMSLAARTIWAALQVAWSAFITAMATTWTVVSTALQTAWSAVWNAMSLVARTIWTALQTAWSAFITAMATTWTTVSAALQAAWSAVWNAMSTVARTIWTALQAAWTAFINAMTTIWNTASAALQSTWSAAWNAMSNVANTIWNALKTAWTATVTTLTNVCQSAVTAISNLWESAWNHIKNVADTIWNWLTSTWHSIVTTLTNFTSSSVTAISNLWESAWNHIKNVANTIWNWLTSTWHSIVTTLTNFTSSSVTTISNLWESAWNHIKNVATSVWNGLKSAFGTFKDWMISTTKSLVSGMSDAWGKIEDAFKKPIHFIISTVINGGIIKAANWVIDKLGGGGSTIPNVPVPFATGGYVSGPGTGTSDSIPARLSNGEYVLNAAAVSKIGVDNLHHMNRTGEMANNYAAMSGFGGAVDSRKFPQLAEAISGYAGGMADGGLADGDLLSLFESAIKAAGGAAADVLSTLIGGAAETAGDVAGDIVGAIGGIFGHPHAGDSLKGHGDDVAGAIQAAFGMLEDAAMGGITDKVFDLIADKLLSGISGTGGPLGAMGLGFGKKAGEALLSGVIKEAFKTFLGTQKQKAAEVYAASVAGSKSVQAWAPLVVKALAMEHLPMSWLPKILSMMQQESGGNPNATNNWDSNAAAGTPSMGLMQTIAPTFSAYHWPGTSNNILDPLANIAAALNYIKHRYGYPPGSPYANGTPSATPGVHLVGENGPEMVLFGGGETVKNAADTSAILSGSTAGGTLPTVSSGAATSDKQLADSLAAWQDYMAQIQTISDTAWQDVATTAAANWSDMQTGSAPFVANMTKAFTDGGNSISTVSKNTWDSVKLAAQTSWDAETTAGTAFNTNLQKQFSDSGTAIQTKWASDLASSTVATQGSLSAQTDAANAFSTNIQQIYSNTGTALAAKWTSDLATSTAATQDSFSSQSDAANAFGADIQQIYSDTSTAIQSTWKNALDGASSDANSYITDTKGSFSTVAGTLQSAFVQPVSDLLTAALPAAFATSVANIGSAWEDLKTTVREPVAAVVDVVFNKGIVAMWNAIAGTFDAPTLDSFTMPAYATGGQVSGPGTGTSDSITAKLSNGEHVWTAAEVKAAGGHGNVAAMRSAVMGGAGVRMLGANGRYADGGAVVGSPQGGTSSTQGATSTGNPLVDAANAPLGSIKDISNPFITAAGEAGKSAISALLPGQSAYGTMLNNMVDQMVGTVTGWITANDVLPTIGGVNDAAAQAWADAQVGKPYALGGNFGATFDCSQYMSGIARAILGETPAPWFTTFAFSGDTAPSGFERELTAPFMIGITNIGVGHTAGTLNGKNYEATPPAVRSGPSARGYDDPMFQDWYGFRPSIEATVGAVTDQNHLAIIDAAMAAAGVPPPDTVAAWEAGMNTIIIRESNWDPNAINNWDSNAAAGMPSQGLAQVIPPTFAAYHVAGTSNNILDPIANVAAAINYIVHTYGSISNVQQANPNLPPKGYFGGTRGAQRGWHSIGERGPEWVNFKGGEEVYPNGVTPPEWRGGDAGGNISIENHFHGPVTKEALQYAEGPFSEKLRQACKAGVGKRGRH